nr:hypothetical protein [Tanacetum cinerariifolium]
NENEVHVSLSSCDKPKKHDDKDKRYGRGKSPIDLSIGVRDLRFEFEEFSFNNTNRVNAASAPVTTSGPNPTNSTNSFNTASPSDVVVSLNFEIARKSSFVDPSNYLDDPYMPALEDIAIQIMKKIVYKDHPVTQIISDLTLAPQTRSMARIIKEQGFEDPDYPDKVYMVLKHSMGCIKLLELDVKSTSTLIEIEKPLPKDPDGEDVDIFIYRSMIGSLMYLTSSRPDIMFVVCACA